jgi:hypothetical protein
VAQHVVQEVFFFIFFVVFTIILPTTAFPTTTACNVISWTIMHHDTMGIVIFPYF